MEAITSLEHQLLACVGTGTMARGKLPEGERIVRAPFLRWLLIQEKNVDFRGFQMHGAVIKDDLDLAHTRIDRPLVFHHCQFQALLSLRHAHCRHLDLSGSSFSAGIDAHGLTVEEDFEAPGLRSYAPLIIEDARIGRNLVLDKGVFLQGDTPSGADAVICADGTIIAGDLNMQSAHLRGGHLRVIGVEIGGDLNLTGTRIENPYHDAINAQRIHIKGTAFLRNGFRAYGCTNLDLAEIGRNLRCQSSTFINDHNRAAINAPGISVQGNVDLKGCKCSGKVDLSNAKIGLSFHANGGRFSATGCALKLDDSRIESSVYLRQITVEGHVRLCNMWMGRDLWCVDMTIHGHTDRHDGRRIALRADAMHVTAGFFFYSMANRHQNSPAAPGSPDLVRPNIDGWVHLSHASVGHLNDKGAPWPNNYHIDNFTYFALGGGIECDNKQCSQRIQWLRHEGDGKFRPQPYDQLADVFRRSGKAGDARTIMIEKKAEERRKDRMNRLDRAISLLLGITVAYGYQPARAGLVLAGLFILGGFLFGQAYDHGYVVPAREAVYMAQCRDDQGGCQGWQFLPDGSRAPRGYPVFNSWVYSIESLVPLVHLDQCDHWRLTDRPKGGWGEVFSLYRYLHIGLGWILSTIAVASVTGIVRR